MAEPITKIKRMEITKEAVQEQNLQEINEAVADNKEAILEGIELLASLHEKGFLEMGSALVRHKEDALANVMEIFDKPKYSAILGNLSKLLLLLGEVKVDEMAYLLNKLNSGMQEAAAADESVKTGYLDLVRAVNNPDINRSLTMLLAFLKGMGR
ncbi:DUF1641 domain-containing protein [Virgibacillus halophilus]|uniref:DUF1641 domain-containing protein n=1 Tax=Tigheibacillus halophilus TaxID=361280 RepID=A0ABU5CA54_9BACI|nr:DUF1641 domain-containing protein [Virgibacillus halophilus]